MNRSVCFFAVAVLAGALSGCPEEVEPGELRASFDPITGLPASVEPPATPFFFELPVRNIGETDVTISEVTFEEIDGAPGENANFTDVTLDVTAVARSEQAVIRFNYATPDGDAQSALMVIASDAEVNPRYEIEVHTRFANAAPPDGGDDAPPDGGGDEGPSDGGEDEVVDSGAFVDAGDDLDGGDVSDAG